MLQKYNTSRITLFACITMTPSFFLGFKSVFFYFTSITTVLPKHSSTVIERVQCRHWLGTEAAAV